MSVCLSIKQDLGELFECRELNGYTRIRTPFLYPDGDVIDIFFQQREGVPTLTDLGETLRWLRGQSLAMHRSPRQNKLLEDVCLNHALELYRGMLVTRFRQDETAAAAVMRIAQGALRVADLWFTFRTRSVESATDEVELFLLEREIPFSRAEKLAGRSGRTWTVDFHTRTPRKSSFVYVLSTGSKSAARSVAEHVLAAWYDLNPLVVTTPGLQFVSLFDDTMDVWAAEDFKLVEDLSTVTRWSRPDEFAEILAA